MLLVVCHLCKKLAEVWESVRLHSRNVAHSRFLPWDIYIYSRRRCHDKELTIVFRSILALMVLPGYVAPIRFRLSGEWWDIMCFIAGSSASNGQIGQEIARKQEQRPPQTSHPIISCCARTWPWCSNLQSTFCFAFCFFGQMPLLVQTTTQTCPMPNAWLLLVGCWRRFICNSVSSFIAVGSLSTMGQSLYRNDGFTYPQDTLRNDYKAINLAQQVSCFQDMCSMPCFFLAHGVEIHENTMALSLSHGTTWRELQGSESEVKPTCHPAIETLGMQTSRVVAWCFGQPLP